MPLKGDGNTFIGNKIGIHNEAGTDVVLNNSIFKDNIIGYLEGYGINLDELFKKDAPEVEKNQVLKETMLAVKENNSDKVESIFKKYDFHKWIATGVNITKIISSISRIFE